MRAQKVEMWRLRVKGLSLQEARLPSPPLTSLTRSEFFPVVLGKHTERILGENPSLCSCHFITGLSALFSNQFVTDFTSKGKQPFVIPMCLYHYHT